MADCERSGEDAEDEEWLGRGLWRLWWASFKWAVRGRRARLGHATGLVLDVVVDGVLLRPAV